jgi:hypothetical protein
MATFSWDPAVSAMRRATSKHRRTRMPYWTNYGKLRRDFSRVGVPFCDKKLSWLFMTRAAVNCELYVPVVVLNVMETNSGRQPIDIGREIAAKCSPRIPRLSFRNHRPSRRLCSIDGNRCTFLHATGGSGNSGTQNTGHDVTSSGPLNCDVYHLPASGHYPYTKELLNRRPGEAYACTTCRNIGTSAQ